MKKMLQLAMIFGIVLTSCLAPSTPEWCQGSFCNPEAVQDSIQIDSIDLNTSDNLKYQLVIYNGDQPVAWDSILNFVNQCFPKEIQFQIISVNQLNSPQVINDKVEDDAFRASLPYRPGPIHIYLCPDDDVIDLLGFVWMPSTEFNLIATEKQFNQVFIAPTDVRETLTHELGHAFGLPHKFEDELNHMSYARFPTQFDSLQIQTMIRFGEMYRPHNLMEREL